MTADTCGEHKAALVCGKIYKKRRFLLRKYFFESATNRIGKGNIEPCSNFCIWRVTAHTCGERVDGRPKLRKSTKICNFYNDFL